MSAKTTIKQNQITEGVIWKQLLLFFFPILLGTFFQQLYNTADAIIVGKYIGTEALAAVGGSTELLIKLILGFFIGVSSGAGVIISQYYGAQRINHLKQAISTALIVAVAGGLLFTAIGIAATPWALRIMGTPEEIIPGSTLYLRVYFAGMVPILIYNMGAGILRAVGNSKMPMYLLIVCCLFNVVLDILFVPVFQWGIFGAALATTLSQAISAVLVLAALFRTKENYQVRLQEFYFSKRYLFSILRIGLPVGLQSVMYNFSNVILQACINDFGTNTIAAWTIFGKIDGIFWMIQNSLGIAITTFVGQNFGARKYERIKKSVWVCLGMSFLVTIVVSTFFYVFCDPLYHFFSNDPAVIELGVAFMHFMVPSYITYVGIEIFSGAIRATGDAFKPLLITCFGICMLRIAWVAVLLPVFPDMRTIILSYPASWLITTVLFVLYYWKGKWRRVMEEAPAQKGTLL